MSLVETTFSGTTPLVISCSILHPIRTDGFYVSSNSEFINTDGVYVSSDTKNFLRFYEEDSLVLAVTCVVDEGEEHEMLKWFNRDAPDHIARGVYHITSDHISFETRTSAGPVQYEGRILDL